MSEQDPIRPSYYKGDLVDQIIELFRLNFRLGNAVKYILREAGKDSDKDLRKAIWYLEQELKRRHEVQENRDTPLADLVSGLAATRPVAAPHTPEVTAVVAKPAVVPDNKPLPATGWVRVGNTMRVRNPATGIELGSGDEGYELAAELSGGWAESRKNTPP